jgi:hypothetical protein
MSISDIKIVVEMKNYIDQHGANSAQWYVGLAEYPAEVLLDHGVNTDEGEFIYLTATCREDAESIAQYFVTRLGTDGEVPSNNNEEALSIYAYKKTPSTQP